MNIPEQIATLNRKSQHVVSLLILQKRRQQLSGYIYQTFIRSNCLLNFSKTWRKPG